jgi:hypothetical protein
MPAALTPGHVPGCCWPVALTPAELQALHNEAVHVTQPLLGARAVLDCPTIHNDAAVVRDSPARKKRMVRFVQKACGAPDACAK